MSRIITGKARGQKLATPGHQRTRPTADRVREALFSALVSWVDGQDEAPEEGLSGFSLLDLYAGTGAVGLEAASRGAAPVWLVESDRRTADLARRNATSTHLEVGVRPVKVEQLLAEPPGGSVPGGDSAAGGDRAAGSDRARGVAGGFDLVWADPPYDLTEDRLARVLRLVVDNGWLAEAGLVVVERSSRGPEPTWPTGVGERWSRRYGETTLWFAEAAEPAPSGDQPDDQERA